MSARVVDLPLFIQKCHLKPTCITISQCVYFSQLDIVSGSLSAHIAFSGWCTTDDCGSPGRFLNCISGENRDISQNSIFKHIFCAYQNRDISADTPTSEKIYKFETYLRRRENRDISQKMVKSRHISEDEKNKLLRNSALLGKTTLLSREAAKQCCFTQKSEKCNRRISCSACPVVTGHTPRSYRTRVR